MTGESAPCDPNWRDNPEALDALCDIGAQEFHDHTTTPSRDTTTIQLTGDYL